jgi:large subunit ribosomal protein L17
MRHKFAGKKLNRTTGQRQSLIKTQIGQLVEHGSLTTTEAKAKLIRSQFAKYLAKANDMSFNTIRLLTSHLSNDKLAKALIALKPKLESKSLNYLRLGTRRGDNTMMVKLELNKKPLPVEPKKKLAKRLTSKTKK